MRKVGVYEEQGGSGLSPRGKTCAFWWNCGLCVCGFRGGGIVWGINLKWFFE